MRKYYGYTLEPHDTLAPALAWTLASYIDTPAPLAQRRLALIVCF